MHFTLRSALALLASATIAAAADNAFDQCACSVCSQYCYTNYCNGQTASAKCVSCLGMACASAMMSCQAN
jgi:hypothetical protein